MLFLRTAHPPVLKLTVTGLRPGNSNDNPNPVSLAAVQAGGFLGGVRSGISPAFHCSQGRCPQDRLGSFLLGQCPNQTLLFQWTHCPL